MAEPLKLDQDNWRPTMSRGQRHMKRLWRWLFPRKEPTLFQKCLAVHVARASNSSAFDE